MTWNKFKKVLHGFIIFSIIWAISSNLESLDILSKENANRYSKKKSVVETIDIGLRNTH